MESKLGVAQVFHPCKLRLERGREGSRVWAGVGREEVEVVPVPLRPDVGDVIKSLLFLKRTLNHRCFTTQNQPEGN